MTPVEEHLLIMERNGYPEEVYYLLARACLPIT